MDLTLTEAQLKELNKQYRYIRFVPDRDECILQGKKRSRREKNVPWEKIDLPEKAESGRTDVKLYLGLVIDLDEMI